MIHKVGEIIRHKTMVDKSIRVELDLGEISGDLLSRLYEMEKNRTVGIVILTPEDYEKYLSSLGHEESY